MSLCHPLEATLHPSVPQRSHLQPRAIDLVHSLTVVCSTRQNVLLHLELQTTVVP